MEMLALVSELKEALAEVECAYSKRCSFAERVRALDALEARVLAHLHALPRELASEFAGEATRLGDVLEMRNLRIAERLRARIADERYTREGLRRILTDGATDGHTDELDWRDTLIASLMHVRELDEERLGREPGLVFYQPTPVRVILRMLELAEVRPSDVLCDLGSGLGHVLVTTALVSGAQVVGIEREPAYVAYARRAVQQLALRNVELFCADARDASFGASNVFFMYTPFRGAVLREVLLRLRQLASERPLRVCTFGPCTTEVAQERWLEPRSTNAARTGGLGVFDAFQP